MDIHICLNLRTISLGSLQKSNCSSLINFLIVLLKYFIYFMKIRNITPTFAAFKSYVGMRYKIEYEIAFMNGKLQIHDQKYQVLKEKLNLNHTL